MKRIQRKKMQRTLINKGGRPEHKPTDESRAQVSMWVAGKMPVVGIAQCLGLSEPTLRKHYAYELDNGRYTARGWLIEQLRKATKKGNVSANKHLLGMTDDVDPYTKPIIPVVEEKAPKLGKKAAADVAAVDAEKGTSFADFTEEDEVPAVGKRH